MNDLYKSSLVLPLQGTPHPDKIDIIANILWQTPIVIIFASFVFAIRLFLKKQIPFRAFLPFVLNLIVLFTLTIISTTFGLSEDLTAISMILFLLTLLWSMVATYPYARWLVYIQATQIVWIIFSVLIYHFGQIGG